MKTEYEIPDDDPEAKFWQEWDGKTDCFGTVAKLVLLLLIVAQAIWTHAPA